MIQLGNSKQNKDNSLTPEIWNYRFSNMNGVAGSNFYFTDKEKVRWRWSVNDRYRTTFKLEIRWHE